MGGPAETGSWLVNRSMSLARPIAESYRRSRSLASAFITIQSRSPFTSRESRAGSTCRLAARLGSVSEELIRLDGVGGSSSRITRSISSSAARFIVSRRIGVEPVSNSYRITPSA